MPAKAAPAASKAPTLSVKEEPAAWHHPQNGYTLPTRTGQARSRFARDPTPSPEPGQSRARRAVPAQALDTGMLLQHGRVHEAVRVLLDAAKPDLLRALAQCKPAALCHLQRSRASACMLRSSGACAACRHFPQKHALSRFISQSTTAQASVTVFLTMIVRDF